MPLCGSFILLFVTRSILLALFLIMLPPQERARVDRDKFYVEKIVAFATYDAAYVLDLANGLLPPNKQVTEADVKCVINELRNSGLFEDVRIEWTEQRQGIKTLNIHTTSVVGREGFVLSGIKPFGMPELSFDQFVEQMKPKLVKTGSSLLFPPYPELNDKLDAWFRESASSDVAKKYGQTAWITFRPTGPASVEVLVLPSRPDCKATIFGETRRRIPSVQTVRSDFREASVIVRMNITETKSTGREEHAHYFTAAGQVIESFKGKFKPGQHLEFNVRAEYGYHHTAMRGDQIAFLTSFVDRRNGPFQVLPSGNSVGPYSPELLATVRRVSREWHRSRARLR